MSVVSIRLMMTERARALVLAELERASEFLMLDLEEMREHNKRGRALNAIAIITESLSALADVREQITADTKRNAA